MCVAKRHDDEAGTMKRVKHTEEAMILLVGDQLIVGPVRPTRRFNEASMVEVDAV
jgi:hypothetical protein